MKHERRTKGWWQKLVVKWRRSGRSASTFAEQVGVRESTLRWWAWSVERDTRAVHGSADIIPIEIAVPAVAPAAPPISRIELEVGGVGIRFEVGTDVSYVAALARALGEP